MAVEAKRGCGYRKIGGLYMPPANTMGHCYVEYRGQFVGMVHTNSLHPMSDKQLVIDALKRDLAKQEAKA